MGKCGVRSCGEQRGTAFPEAAEYLILRSGRRVPAMSARKSRRQCRRRCGGKSAAGVPQRCRVLVTPHLLMGGGQPEQEAPAGNNPVVRDDECGDSRQDTLLISVEVSKKHQYPANGVTARPIRSPPEAEMEAFFAAAELAERRRFAETYNYDVALDRPLEGRFEWVPVNT